MSLSLQNELQLVLLDLIDDVKVELSELNQIKDNVTKGPDYKLFERGVMHAMIQGKRQMIDTLQNQLQTTETNPNIIDLIHTTKQTLETQMSRLQKKIPSNNTTNQAYYEEGLTLAQLYETKGKYYVIQIISDKINTIRSEDK
ncbi:hypothetical protein ACY2DA_03560 [Staphylococcus simulans]